MFRRSLLLIPAALMALGGVVAGQGDVSELIKQLKNKDVEVRRSAAYRLAHIGPGAKAAVPALIGSLKDTKMSVRGQAAGALGAIGPDAKEAVPALIGLLKDTAWPTRATSRP